MTPLKKFIAVLAVCLPFAASAADATVGGINFKFSGDLNNRFMLYTPQAGLFGGSETITGTPITPRRSLEEAWGDLKYRFQFEGATADGKIKGVYNIELGSIRFGDGGNINSGTDAIGRKGGGYSGDGDNYETRFAYLDFGLPGDSKARFTLGLQPFLVNKYIWQETATGVQYTNFYGPAKFTAAWMRGRDVYTTNTSQDLGNSGDNYVLRGDFAPMPTVKAGAFLLYQHQNPQTGTATNFAHLLKNFGASTVFDIYNIGIDGKADLGTLFVNFDAIYQTGKLKGSIPGIAGVGVGDLSAFFVHADVGANLGALRLTYTGWYASGDNKPDDKVKNYIATDVDMNDSIILFEGGYTDDNYFTEAPYFLNYGAIFNKVALDYKVDPKLTVGASLMYIMTAEDITLSTGKKSSQIGTELDAYASYKLYPQLEVAVNGGVLFAGDAMDNWESTHNGKSDANPFRITSRVRYLF